MMQIQKRPLSKLKLGVLYSLSESYMMLPFLIFSSLLTEKSTKVNFFVPVIIVYSVLRACLIALRGFGQITNPYRILKGGLLVALPGSILMLLSFLYRPLLMISALLIGIGLSPFHAMFIPIYAGVTEQNPSLKKGKSIGTGLYLLVMLTALVLGKIYLPIVPVLFLLYIVCALWILIRFDGDTLFAHRKAFDTDKSNLVYFVFGTLSLLCLFILRQYKQSSVSALLWLAPSVVIILIILEMFRHRHYGVFVYQTYWAGAVKSYLLLFSLIYHNSVGNSSMGMLIYLAIAMGTILSILLRKLLAKFLPDTKLSHVSMLLSAAFAFLLIAPSQTINLIGIMLSMAFGNITATEAAARYMKDERHEPLERSLVRLRIYAAGTILEQLVLFFTIYLCGEFRIHQNLLEAYAAGIPDPSLSLLLHRVGLICSALLLLSAILIVCFAGKRKTNHVKTEQKHATTDDSI